MPSGTHCLSVTIDMTKSKAAMVCIILLAFLALSVVCKVSAHQLDDASDGAVLEEVAEVAPAATRNRVHVIRFSSGSRFARAIQTENGEEKISKASVRKVLPGGILARRLRALSDADCNAVAVATSFRWAVHHPMGSSDGSAMRQKKSRLILRPIKLFILCKKVKNARIGDVAALSPKRAAPANQHIIPIENKHRRSLKEFKSNFFLKRAAPATPASTSANSQFSFPPFPTSFPPFPPLSTAGFPPLPFTLPAPPLFPTQPSTATLPPVLSRPSDLPTPLLTPLPPIPFTNFIPPLPFQIPPVSRVPSSSSVKTLPRTP